MALLQPPVVSAPASDDVVARLDEDLRAAVRRDGIDPQGEAPAVDENAKPEDAVAGIIGEITKNPVKAGENRPALRRIVEKIRRPRYWRKDPVYGEFEVRAPTAQEIRRDFVRTRKYDTVEGSARVGDIVKTINATLRPATMLGSVIPTSTRRSCCMVGSFGKMDEGCAVVTASAFTLPSVIRVAAEARLSNM